MLFMTFGNVTGLFAGETVGEAFATLGVSFAIQNLIVARRSIAKTPQPHPTTA
jgi:hypothetical protein